MAVITEQAVKVELQRLGLAGSINPLYMRERIVKGVEGENEYIGLSLDIDVTHDRTEENIFTPARNGVDVGVINASVNAYKNLKEVFVDATAITVASRLGKLKTPAYVEVVTCKSDSTLLHNLGFVTIEEWATGTDVGLLAVDERNGALDVNPFDFDADSVLDDAEIYRNFMLGVRAAAQNPETRDIAFIAMSAVFEKAQQLHYDEKIYIGAFSVVSHSIGLVLNNTHYRHVRDEIAQSTSYKARKLERRKPSPSGAIKPKRSLRTSASSIIRRS